MTKKSTKKIIPLADLATVIQQAHSALARKGAKARWSGSTPESRKTAMKKAHAARKANAKIAREYRKCGNS